MFLRRSAGSATWCGLDESEPQAATAGMTILLNGICHFAILYEGLKGNLE